MAGNPYSDLPKSAYWRRSISEVPPAEVDPMTSARYRITATDKVVTAGSCFAQHIGRRLEAERFLHFVTEPPLSFMDKETAESYNYGIFSARYGNIYTPRQLKQLFDRAFERFAPADNVWCDGHTWVDPYRPRIQPDGFSSETEFNLDRSKHLAAVRRAIKELDVFVFTFGLTEAWRNRHDGAVYPLAPGVAGGTFDADQHEFCNFSVSEIVEDMEAALATLFAVNPKARVLLTVSPVPLVATAEARHVLVSTVYSKSVLRVAADILCRQHRQIDYFPSYEIITGPHARGRYFAEDCRSVTAAGVEQVLRVFFRHYAGMQDLGAPRVADREAPTSDHLAQMEAAAAATCDEEMLDSPISERKL